VIVIVIVNIISVNSVNRFIFVMVKCCVFLEVRPEFLIIILTRFGFQGIKRFQSAVMRVCVQCFHLSVYNFRPNSKRRRLFTKTGATTLVQS
jgi:hypothetical protein